MNEKILVSVSVMLACCIARAEFPLLLDGGWRLSAGAAYDPAVKSHLHFTPPRQQYQAPSSWQAGQSKADAVRQAMGKTGEDGVYEFPNGAWVDMNDPVASEGDDVGKTRYYKFPGPAGDNNGTFELGEVSYSEVEVVQGEDVSQQFSDDAGMAGINIELSRNLFHDETIGWGLDLALDVFYFHRNDLFSTSLSWMNGVGVHRSGVYRPTMTLAEGDYHPINWHGDGDGAYYGSGSKDGNAGPISEPTLNLNGTEMIDRRSSSGALYADGDYDNLEFMLLLRPYYDLFDWLRINAMVGLAVSRQSLDLAMTVMQDGRVDYRSSRSFDQWDAYGVAGAGLMLYYQGFTLSADFLARFLDRDLDIHDRYVNGAVERGDWLFKLTVGYEF